MCGLIGFAFNFFKPNTQETKDSVTALKEVFSDMLVKTQKYGEHATGVAVLNRGHKIIYAKDNKSSDAFVKTNQYKELLNHITGETRAIIGHCRSATSGTAAINENNHPHIYGKTIGIHNGTISNYEKVAKKWGIKLFTDCDSELVFALYDTLREHLKLNQWRTLNFINHQLEGTIALAMFSKHDEDELILVKNRSNSLDLGRAKCAINDQNVYIFATSLYEIYPGYGNPLYPDVLDFETRKTYFPEFPEKSAVIIKNANLEPTFSKYA